MICLLLSISYTLHAKDVFQPPKAPPASDWTAAAPNRDPIEFRARDGSQIRGWLYKSDDPQAAYVLFFYGSNEDLAREAGRLRWLRDTFHVNAMCFDDPGYGFSTGRIDANAIRSVAVEEFDYIRDHLARTGGPVVVYGWSIGSGIAIHVAAQRRASGLILQAPPASADEMLQWSSHHDIPWYARGAVRMSADAQVRQSYEGAAEIATVDCPLLVIQGEKDDVVPVDQGREVFRASPAKQKRFVEVPGAHHNDLQFRDPPASDAVRAFLETIR